jgi:hypothetical protein
VTHLRNIRPGKEEKDTHEERIKSTDDTSDVKKTTLERKEERLEGIKLE